MTFAENSDAGRVAPISVSVWCLRLFVYVLPDSSLCQNGKQIEIITKMIFELCYIEAIIIAIIAISMAAVVLSLLMSF